MQLRVPVDDTHTMQYQVSFVPSSTVVSPADGDVDYEYCPLKENGVYNMNIVTAQDSLAWESQGGIADRSQENLGVTDRGIVMLRKLLKEQIEVVRNGGDPMGVIRDPEKNKIIDLDTFHEPFGLYRHQTHASETTGTR